MDAMVALLDAGLSGLRSTPSPGDAHLSGESSPVHAHAHPVSTRLSYGPPTAVETPASAPSHAAPMPGSPPTAVGAAISTVGTVPMAHQADRVAAALTLAASATEKADMAATIRQMQQQLDCAAMVAEITQLRLERENTQLRHDAQLLAVTASAERDVARAQKAAVPDLLRPPAVPIADGAPPVAPAVTKLIMGQLVLNNPPAIVVSNTLDDLAGVKRISEVVLRLMKGLHIVSGGPSFRLAIAQLFHLPDLHELVDADDVAYQTAVAVLHACAHHGRVEDFQFDDAASAVATVDSNAPGARKRDIFGGDHEARRTYQCLAHFLSGGDGDLPHPAMANWVPMDTHAAGYLQAMLGDGPTHKDARKQTAFIKIVHSLLLANKHTIASRLLSDFAAAVNPADYTNKAGTFFGIKPTAVMLGLGEDIKLRMDALETVKQHPLTFAVFMALQSLPIGDPGSATQQAFDRLKCKLHVEAAKPTTVDEVLAIIHNAVERLGVEEPEGGMSAAAAATYVRAPAAASALETAAGAIQPGGGKGGKGKGTSKSTATVQLGAPPPTKAAPVEPTDGERSMPQGMTLCPAGQNCTGFGTLAGCGHWHLAAVIAFIQRKYGNAYISPKARKAIMAAQHAAHASAPTPPPGLQPPAPQPGTSAEADQVAKSAAAAELLASVRRAQHEFSGCAVPASVAPAHGGLTSSVRGCIHTPAVRAFALALPAAPAAGAPAALDDAALDGAFKLYGEWLTKARADCEAMSTADASAMQQYRMSHGGRTHVEHHSRLAAMYTAFFAAALDVVPMARQLALAARIQALEILIILDSGATKWYSDGTGRADLQPCDEVRAAQAGGTEMKTNQKSTYSVVLKDVYGKLFRLSNSESRHVPGLGGRLTPLVIIPPYDLLESGAVWNNKCLTDAYIRLPLGDGRLSGKIPVSWFHRVATLTAASEHDIRRGGIIEVCISAAGTLGAPATATSSLDLSTCSLSSPAAQPLPAPDTLAPVGWTSDGNIIAFGTHLTCVTCYGSGPSRRDSEGQPAGTHLHPAVSSLPVPPVSTGAGNQLDAGPLHCSAMDDGPADVLTPVVVAAPAIPIDADTQRSVDAIDAATARVEWAGAAFTAVSGLGMSQTVTARMRDVSAVNRIATVSPAVRTGNRQRGYRVLEHAPSTLCQPGCQSGTDRLPPTAPPRRPSIALAAHSRVTRPPAAAPTSRPEYRLCACPAASLGHGCVGTRVSGSDFCVACQNCTPTECRCRCCGHLDGASALEAPAGDMGTSDLQWPTGEQRPKWIYSLGAGSMTHIIRRLDQHPNVMGLVTDVMPMHTALADLAADRPELLSRIVYVQVQETTMPTTAWLERTLRQRCGATLDDVVELSNGIPCDSYSTRSGRHPPRNPHRAVTNGRWYPTTRVGALADRFRAALLTTIRTLVARAATPADFVFLIENPAFGLLPEQEDMKIFMAEMNAAACVVDHCVAATAPADLAIGVVSNKPSRWIHPGHRRLPDIRCCDFPCNHRLAGDPAQHEWVIQHQTHAYSGPQRRVPPHLASRVPQGAYDVLPLDLWLSPVMLAALARPTQVPVRRLELAASAPHVAAASPHVLHRLTPDACVYDAATLHAVFGHNVAGAKLRDTVSLCTGFSMRRADGTIVRAPFVELADVQLPHQCPVCTCTQMQDAGSRHTARARSAAAAPIAAFAVPLRA